MSKPKLEPNYLAGRGLVRYIDTKWVELNSVRPFVFGLEFQLLSENLPYGGISTFLKLDLLESRASNPHLSARYDGYALP